MQNQPGSPTQLSLFQKAHKGTLMELRYDEFARGLPVPLSWFHTKPLAHQLATFKFGLKRDCAALLLPIGSGKTKAAIDILRYRIEQGQVKRALIVCPLSVLSTWEFELEKHSDLKFEIMEGNRLEKIGSLLAVKEPPEILVCHYESVRIYEKGFRAKGFDMVIADECLSGDTLVQTSDGSKRISNLKPGNLVRSFNFQTEQVELKTVKKVFRKPRFHAFVKLHFGNKSKSYSVICTASHKFFSSRGIRSAKKLQIGDSIYKAMPDFSDFQRKVLIGCMLGDASIHKTLGQIWFVHSEKQKEYFDLKRKLFQVFANQTTTAQNDWGRSNYFFLSPTETSKSWRKLFYPNGKKIVPIELLNEADEVSLAFWYLDDGSRVKVKKTQLLMNGIVKIYSWYRVQLHTQGFSPQEVRKLQIWLRDRFGIQTISSKVRKDQLCISIRADSQTRFFNLIRPYIPRCMDYKTPYEGKFSITESMTVPSIEQIKLNRKDENFRPLKNPKKRLGRVYDLEVKDNHNYILANGIIVSNSTKIKNPGIKLTWAFYRAFARTSYKLILTGLPTPNNILDIFSQYKFLDASVFGTRYADYKAMYATLGGYDGKAFIGPRNIEHFRKRLYSAGITFPRKDLFDLPPKTYQTRTVKLSADESAAYYSMKENFLMQLSTTERIVATNVLTQLLRLHQINSGFITNGDGVTTEIGTSKFKTFTDYMEREVLGTETKILVFVQFLHTLRKVQEWATKKKLNPSVVYGAVRKKRAAEIRRFQDDPTSQLFLGQISTVNLGLDLTAASVAIFLESNFSWGDRNQCEGRIDRLGQTKKTTIIDFVVPDSIDTYVLSILKTKKKFSDVILRPQRLLTDGQKGLF